MYPYIYIYIYIYIYVYMCMYARIGNILAGPKLEYEFIMLDVYTHYKRIGHVIISKPHFSSHEGINYSHCRRFDLVLFDLLVKSVAAK